MVGLGCSGCGGGRPAMATGYYFPRVAARPSGRRRVRSAAAPVVLSPHYRFLGGMGDGWNPFGTGRSSPVAPPPNSCVYYKDDGVTIESVEANSNASECASTGGSWNGAPAPVATAPPAVDAGAAAFLASGSVLTYTVRWAASLFQTSTASGVISKINAPLSSKWGIQVLDVSIPASGLGTAATLTLQTTRDYGTADDVRSIVDGELHNAGFSVAASSIAIGRAPGGDIGSWLANNWPLLALGVGGAIVLKKVL